MYLTAGGGRTYGVFLGEGDNPSHVAAIRADGTLEPLGAAPQPRSLLPAPGGVYAASAVGLTWHRPGAPTKTLHAGPLQAAAADGTALVFAECESETSGCTVARLTPGAGALQRAATRFPIVNGVAAWQGKLYVTGRQRDPREGVPLTAAEIAEQARWLTQGGLVPASARNAPGFVAVVDPAGGETVYWPFPEHRPVAVVADGGDLWLLTEGTLGRGLTDAVLVRISAAGDWSVVATKLAMPDRLKASEHRLCWREMPASRFTVRCLDKRSGAIQTLVEQEWNVLDFVIDGNTLVWSTLTKGVQRAPLP